MTRCETCQREAPCVSVFGLSDEGWTATQSGWKCSDCCNFEAMRQGRDAVQALIDLKVAEKDKEIARLKSLIDRDRTGLANALNGVRQVFNSYYWIAVGEWGNYEWQERTEKHFRAEIKRCFDEAEKIAVDALRKSGSLANEAFRPN